MKNFEIILSDVQCDKLQVVANKTRDFNICDDDDARNLIQDMFDKTLEDAFAPVA